MLIKLLVLGTNQLNYPRFLYTGLRKISDEFHVTLGVKVSGSDLKFFDSTIPPELNVRSILAGALSVGAKRIFWQLLFFILFVEGKFLKTIHFVFEWILANAFVRYNDDFKSIDIVHFHFIQYSYIRHLFFVPKSKKIVCSFWGSDLLRTHDTFNHLIVKKALERSDIITVQSMEMQQILLAKFGRHLNPKVRVLKFVLNHDVFEAIDTLTTHEVNEFMMRWNLIPNLNIIVLGNSASRYNNHPDMIRSIKELPDHLSVQLVIPFNYGMEQEERIRYRKELEYSLRDTKYPFVFIDEYLNAKQLACLRRVTSVMVHLPESDALSGAATEAMYAGSSLITAAWLPYSPFKNNGLTFSSIDAFDKLRNEIVALIKTPIADSAKRDNRRIVQEVFLSDSVSEQWLILFKDLSPNNGTH
jgi:hypothetical protein